MGNRPAAFLTPQLARKDAPLSSIEARLDSQSAARLRALARLRPAPTPEAEALFSNLSTQEKQLVKDSWQRRPPAPPPSTVTLLLSKTLAAESGTCPSIDVEPSPAIRDASVNIVCGAPLVFWFRMKTTHDNVDQLRSSPKVRGFAARLEEFLDAIIGLLNEENENEKCKERIAELALLHLSYNVTFDAQTLLLFKRSLVDAVCAEEPEPVKIAWIKFLARLFCELKRSFHAHIQTKNSRCRRISSVSDLLPPLKASESFRKISAIEKEGCSEAAVKSAISIEDDDDDLTPL